MIEDKVKRSSKNSRLFKDAKPGTFKEDICFDGEIFHENIYFTAYFFDSLGIKFVNFE